MVSPAASGDSRRPQRLDSLLRRVHEARSRLDLQRAAPMKRHTSTVDARRELLAALESYAAALESAGRPVPYRIRDELHLYRGLDLSR
jgi:hypothetical protein